jgi:hypothetical protein
MLAASHAGNFAAIEAWRAGRSQLGDLASF